MAKGTLGIPGALAFTAGAALGAFSGLLVGHEISTRFLPETSWQVVMTALAIFGAISGGGLVANLCGFAISFDTSLLVQCCGLVLIACGILACIVEKIYFVFSKAFAKH